MVFVLMYVRCVLMALRMLMQRVVVVIVARVVLILTRTIPIQTILIRTVPVVQMVPVIPIANAERVACVGAHVASGLV